MRLIPPPLPVLAIAAAIIADLLLWSGGLGLGAAIFTLVCGAMLAARGRTPVAAWIAIGGAGLVLVIDPGPLAVLVALGLVASAAMLARGWLPQDALAAAGGTLRAWPVGFWRMVRDFPVLRRLRYGVMGRLGRWFVPVVLAGVFVVIFAIANPVISARLGEFARWLGRFDLPSPGRVALWWLAAAGLWLLARARLRSRVVAGDAGLPGGPDAGWTLRCLVAFNLAFLLQNGCDAVYLWGGAGLPEGMTYAAYAHRGAYPLVVAALLAGAFVLACVRPGGAAESSRTVRHLVFAFLVQTVVLTASAWWRLDLYVDVYGLTRWRLAALIWMALIAIGVALIIWRIRCGRGNRWLVSANLRCLGVVLAVVALANVDGFIASHDVERVLDRHTTVPLDVDYVADLGPAALPALVRYCAAVRDPQAAEAVQRLRLELRSDLGDWRGWTWRRRMVAEALAER